MEPRVVRVSRKNQIVVVSLLALWTSALCAQSTVRPAIVVHGGVDNIEPAQVGAARQAAIKRGITEALNAGYDVLKRGGSSVDAVETALRKLEDLDTFDAGRGAEVNTEGMAELDAAIMDGKTLQAGSVAAVHRIPHPISAARLVMDHSRHVMLVGNGAEEFANSQGMALVPNSFFVSDFRRQQYQEWLRSRRANSPKQHGTTGAIAIDVHGNLAAGTSTGGTPWKLPGRVGDSPIIGAGTYANNSFGCAVSGSGAGEFFIRNTVAGDLCRRVAYLHETIDQAANSVINGEITKQGADGGVIVMDASGHFVRVFNTTMFSVGYIDAKGNPVVNIFH